MKRMVRSLVVLGAIAALAAPAGAVGARVEKFTYEAPSQAGIDNYGVWYGPGCAGDQCVGGSVNYKTSKAERAVNVKIVDATGASVKGMVIQDGIEKEFCGTSGRVPIVGGKKIAIWVSANPCAEGPDAVGVATTGTVITKFSK